jgi:hypothetical protein
VELSSHQYSEITDLSKEAGFSAREIAIYLELPVKAFLRAFNAPDSPIKEAYDRGLLLSEYESRKANTSNAFIGNPTAIQIREKQLRNSVIQDTREALINGQL